MEEDIRKSGLLYLQQQRFGKKWRKVWSILFRESSCSISRLEFFECKDVSTGTLEKSKSKQENKKVIKLSDCIRVADASVDGCPKDCRAFLVETTEKTFVFAVETVELEDWMQKLCEIAFPMNWPERGAARKSSIHTESEDASMADNSLYSGRENVPTTMKDFKVVMKRTDAAERCGLRGHYLLRTDFDSLLLKEPKTGEVLYTWPYRYLRRFGRDKTTFSFEAGRRCDSGEGNFEFDTKQGNAIFQYVESAINLQRVGLTQRQGSCGTLDREPATQPPKPTDGGPVYSMLTEGAMKDVPKQPSPHRTRLETPTDKHLTGVKSLNLDARPPPRKSQVKNFRSCPLANNEDDTYSRVTAPASGREILGEQEEQSRLQGPSSKSEDTEYSLPFDNIAKNIMVDILAASLAPPTLVEPRAGNKKRASQHNAEPLYDSIDESAIMSAFPHHSKRHPAPYRVVEHIYDEPEGCAMTPRIPTSLYDDPEEVKGNAWQMHGTLNDPSGHEYPYNAHVDDYAVPKPPRRAMKLEEKHVTEEEDCSPYDNVILKMKTGTTIE